MTEPPALGTEFLAMLRCPAENEPLALADAALVDRVNEAIEAGTLISRVGEKVDQPLDAALVNQSRSLLYPIHNGIPTLIADEAIPLDQVTPSS